MTTGGADQPKGAPVDAPEGAPLHAAYDKLKTRKQFVAVARGARQHARTLVAQALERPDAAAAEPAPARFGLTVTKKTVPLSVHRNRIRRRFREALRAGAALSGAAGHDYVLVARENALTAPFDQIKSDIAAALSAPVRGRRHRNRPTA